MTRLVALQMDPGTYMVGASIVSLLVGLCGAWCFWRVRTMLGLVPQVTERLSILSNSISLLTDTTEGCFKAVAVQLQTLQPAGPHKGRRAGVAPKRPRATRSFQKSLPAKK